MRRNPVEINKEDLKSAIEKFDTQIDIAEHFGCSQGTISNKIKEYGLEILFNIIKAKHKYNTRNKAASSLGLTLEEFNKHISDYKLEEEAECKTSYDSKKEEPFFTSFEDVKQKADDLQKKFIESIGYDEVEFDLPDRSLFWVFVDSHVGNKHTSHKRITDMVDLTLKYPNIYMAGAGDYCDNFERGWSGSSEQIMTIPEQKEWIKKVFEELKDRMLIVQQGCHDEWMWRREEFDLSQYLARHTKGKPGGFGTLLKLNIGEHTYKIFIRHKISYFTPNSSPTGIMKFIVRNGLNDVDLIITGHHHTYFIQRFMSEKKIITAVIYPSFKITDRFLDQNSYPKSTLNIPAFILGKKKREILLFDNIEEAIEYL